MNKRMIYEIITAIVLGLVFYFFNEDATFVQVAIFIGTYAILSFVFNQIFRKRRNIVQTSAANVEADAEVVNAFIESIGGVENISETEFSSARLKVTLIDVDLIDQEKLNALNFEGAFLSGSQLQVTIGTNSGDFSQQISNLIG